MQNIPDYFDPKVIAHQDGVVEGERQGYARGFQDGRSEGFNDGHAVGYQVGWDAAIARANEELLKQMEFTRQHVADKEEMARQLQEQRELIDKLTARLDEMERGNENLKKTNTALREVVNALKEANERLQTQVSQLDEKYQKRSQEYSDQVWAYNRNMVFMNAVRSTLEDLTLNNSSQAKQVRDMFAKKYSEQVSSAIKSGSISVPLEKDTVFATTLPKTQRFIMDMLSSVATNAPSAIRNSMLEQVQPVSPQEENSLGM
jgi:chromosome segregation ATPase